MRRMTLAAAIAVGITSSALVMAHGPSDSHSEGKRLQFFPDAQSMELSSMGVEGVDAYFEDIVSSGDPKSPIACGLFEIEQGESLEYTYDYDDIKIMLEGSIEFSDGEQTVTGEPGDVVFFPSGSTITFSSEDTGRAFACGQRHQF